MAGKLKKLTEDQAAEAVRLYEGGASLADCAHIFGVSRQGMWDLLRRRTNMRPGKRYGSANHFYRGGPIADAYVHNLVEQALEDGDLVRETACEQCGEQGQMRDGRTTVQAHHDDYNKPLDVQWLCQRCHHEWHKNNTAIARKEVPKEVPQVDLICGGFPIEHVRISVTLERVLGWTALVRGYGSSTFESFANFDPESWLLRTSQRCLLEGWTSYSEALPKAGTMQSGRLYALPTLAPRTGESGCSSWPTPTLGDSKAIGAAGGRHSGTTLTDAAVRRLCLWPTPRNNTGPSTDDRHLSVDGAVRRMRATPVRSDCNTRRPSAGWQGHDLPSQLNEGNDGHLRKLNPDWVCQLMGFPDGWTDVGPPVRTKPKKPGKRRAPRKAVLTEPSD